MPTPRALRGAVPAHILCMYTVRICGFHYYITSHNQAAYQDTNAWQDAAIAILQRQNP